MSRFYSSYLLPVESSVKTGERVGTTGADTKIRVSISTSTRRKNVIIVAVATTVGTTVMGIAITATITGSKPDKLDGNSLPLCVKAESRLFHYEHQPIITCSGNALFYYADGHKLCPIPAVFRNLVLVAPRRRLSVNPLDSDHAVIKVHVAVKLTGNGVCNRESCERDGASFS